MDDGLRLRIDVHVAALARVSHAVDCLAEPNGTQHVQVNGAWVYIEWHGDLLGEPDRCDGCGDAYAQGEAIGQVCADYSSWLDWTSSPFE